MAVKDLFKGIGADSPTLNDSDVLISYEGCGCAGGMVTTVEGERVPIPGTENLKYSAFGTDRVRQRFTGYERDGETQLDFAEARMYQNNHGRFTAPDPLLASASAANPQTFNRYIYTGNNPVNITDPSGLKWCRAGGNGNGVDDIQWFKNGVCSGDWKDLNLDNAYSCNIGPCTISGTIYAQGTVFRFSSDGQYRAALADPGPPVPSQTQTTAQGQSVQQGSAAVSGTTAVDSAASSSGSQGASGTGLLSLCRTGQICGGAPIIVDLTPGASFDEVADFTQYVLETTGAVPGLEIADAISGLISLARGDRTGALLSAGAMIPLGGQVFTAAKWGRRLENAAEVVKRGPSTDPNAPHNKTIREVASQITDGTVIAGGGGKEVLVRTPGGIKSGRRPDILVERPDGSKYGINIGLQTKKNNPVKRESEAIMDLEGPGKLKMYFVPYN